MNRETREEIITRGPLPRTHFMPIQNVYAEATQNVYRRLPIVRGEKEKHRIWFLNGYTECSQLAVLDFFPGGGPRVVSDLRRHCRWRPRQGILRVQEAVELGGVAISKCPQHSHTCEGGMGLASDHGGAGILNA